MLIICPQCESAYEVPAASVTGRKRLRCTRCACEWAPGETAPPAAVPQPAAMVEPAPAAPPARPRCNVPLVMAWAASVALLLGLGWGALHFSAPIGRAWPASLRVYAMVGKAR